MAIYEGSHWQRSRVPPCHGCSCSWWLPTSRRRVGASVHGQSRTTCPRPHPPAHLHSLLKVEKQCTPLSEIKDLAVHPKFNLAAVIYQDMFATEAAKNKVEYIRETRRPFDVLQWLGGWFKHMDVFFLILLYAFLFKILRSAPWLKLLKTLYFALVGSYRLNNVLVLQIVVLKEKLLALGSSKKISRAQQFQEQYLRGRILYFHLLRHHTFLGVFRWSSSSAKFEDLQSTYSPASGFLTCAPPTPEARVWSGGEPSRPLVAHNIYYWLDFTFFLLFLSARTSYKPIPISYIARNSQSMCLFLVAFSLYLCPCMYCTWEKYAFILQ